MYKPNMLHLVTVLALVRHNGGGKVELRDAVYKMRPRLPLDAKPFATKLMRRNYIDKWIDVMIDYYCPEVPPDGNE